MTDFDDTRQNYSAPVNADRREKARIMADNVNSRINMHLNGHFDSCTLQGLADELEEVVRQYRAMGDRSVDEHRDDEIHKYEILVRSVSHYRLTIECTEAEKWTKAREQDGGIFEEIGTGTWEIESVDRAD